MTHPFPPATKSEPDQLSRATSKPSWQSQRAAHIQKSLPYWVTAAALTLAAGVWHWPASSFASGCTPLELRILPDSASENVPTNTRVVVLNAQEAIPFLDATLVRADDGAVVPTQARILNTILGLEHQVLIPAQPLEVGTRYELLAQTGFPLQEFVVSQEADEEAPAVPPVTEQPHDNSVDLVRPLPGDFFVVDIDQESQFAPETTSGTVSGIYAPDQLARIGMVCGGNGHNFDEEGAANLRFATFDLAGNFSGWSDEREVDTTGCQFVAAPASSRPWWAIAVVAAALVSRRRAEPRWR